MFPTIIHCIRLYMCVSTYTHLIHEVFYSTGNTCSVAKSPKQFLIFLCVVVSVLRINLLTNLKTAIEFLSNFGTEECFLGITFCSQVKKKKKRKRFKTKIKRFYVFWSNFLLSFVFLSAQTGKFAISRSKSKGINFAL